MSSLREIEDAISALQQDTVRYMAHATLRWLELDMAQFFAKAGSSPARRAIPYRKYSAALRRNRQRRRWWIAGGIKWEVVEFRQDAPRHGVPKNSLEISTSLWNSRA